VEDNVFWLWWIAVFLQFFYFRQLYRSGKFVYLIYRYRTQENIKTIMDMVVCWVTAIGMTVM
jgi:hypothetical protein